MKSIPRIIGVTAAVALVCAGILFVKKMIEFFEDLNLEEDSECYW